MSTSHDARNTHSEDELSEEDLKAVAGGDGSTTENTLWTTPNTPPPAADPIPNQQLFEKKGDNGYDDDKIIIP